VNTSYNGSLFGNVLHANKSILSSFFRPVCLILAIQKAVNFSIHGRDKKGLNIVLDNVMDFWEAV